jgi:hypothetical protein
MDAMIVLLGGCRVLRGLLLGRWRECTISRLATDIELLLAAPAFHPTALQQ